MNAAGRLLVHLASAVACVLAFAVAAHAQSGGDEPSLDQRLRLHQLLKTPDPSKDVVPPTEAERSQEEDRRAQERARRAPQEQPSRSGPGYIGPLSTETRTGQMGASGWTAPAITTPGSGRTHEERAGQFGFGFSVEWGGSRPPSEAP
jgi:hypothetical protein